MPTTIKSARAKIGRTQAELALAANLNPTHFCRIEGGFQRLTRQTAERLAPILNVSADDLLAGQERLRAALRAELVGAR